MDDVLIQGNTIALGIQNSVVEKWKLDIVSGGIDDRVDRLYAIVVEGNSVTLQLANGGFDLNLAVPN